MIEVIMKRLFIVFLFLQINVIYPDQLGIKFGYTLFNTNVWQPDIFQRITKDEVITGSNNQFQLGTITRNIKSDTNFYYPISIFFQSQGVSKYFYIQADLYQFKKINLRAESIGLIRENINSIIFNEVEHIREQANLKIGLFLMSQGLNQGFFDLILLLGGSWTHHGYTKSSIGYSQNGLSVFSNQDGPFDARVLNPLIGLEVAYPIYSFYGKSFFIYGTYESYPERSTKITNKINNFIFVNNPIEINIENNESDYSLSKQYYELGFGYYLARDFLLKLAYRKEVNLIRYKNYNGYTLSFNQNIQQLTDIYNLSELLSDKFYVYNGTNKEQIEGIFFGFEKAFIY